MLKILYAGSPQVSAQVLQGLLDSGKTKIAGVLTNLPAPQGRRKSLVQTPVGQTAMNAGLKLFTPQKLDASLREKVSSLEPDILVCFAYGKIFGPKFLELFPRGGINLHPSLLPKYRGCAPVPAAILAGDKTTGISIQRIALKMDSGDILLQNKIPLFGSETTESFLETAAQKAVPLLLEVLATIEQGTEKPIPQNEAEATYCTMLKKEDGLIDWCRSALDISAQVRAFYPWPCAFTCAQDTVLIVRAASVFTGSFVLPTDAVPGQVLGIDKEAGILIQTGDGILAIKNLQRQGKKAMHWKDFINGTRNFTGTCCVNLPALSKQTRKHNEIL